MFKFEKLQTLLLKNNKDNIVLTKEELNDLIDGGLNENAFTSRSYFSNDPTHAIYLSWYRCGYYCSKVDRVNNSITLTKLSSSKDRILSSDVLYAYYFNNIFPDFTIIVTPFAFAEICRTRNIRQELLRDYLLNVRALFLNFNGQIISFDDFYTLVNYFGNNKEKLIYRMEGTYQDFVIYVFATCLVNLNVNVDNLIEYLKVSPKLNVDYFNEYTNRWSLRNVFNNLCKSLCAEYAILETKELNPRNLQKFMTRCDPLELLFYDYALENFIEKYKDEDQFIIEPKIVEEMLNVSLLNICKNYAYLTDQIYTQRLLISSIRNRVLIW